MTERIISKYEPSRNGGEIILFFPDAPANPGNIVYYQGAHGECAIEYYMECRPAKGEDGAEAIARYTRRVQSFEPEYRSKRAFRR
jgi:thiamine monophosphate kinase